MFARISMAAATVFAITITSNAHSEEYSKHPAFKIKTSGYSKEETRRIRKFDADQVARIKKTLHKFEQAPMDLLSETLPSKFTGHSCIAIARAISKVAPEKGEFETSHDYESRAESIRSTHLYGSISAADALAFVAEKKVSWISYDADAGLAKFTLFYSGEQRLWDGTPPSKLAIINQEVAQKSRYPGENKLGRKVMVDSYLQDVCAVAFENLTPIDRLPVRPTKFDVDLLPAEAAVMKGNFSVLYIGRLSTPFLTAYSDYIAPTINNPVEVAYTGQLLTINLSEIWLFDSSSGKIFTKIKK